jgi:hypothetical protein
MEVVEMTTGQDFARSKENTTSCLERISRQREPVEKLKLMMTATNFISLSTFVLLNGMMYGAEAPLDIG